VFSYVLNVIPLHIGAGVARAAPRRQRNSVAGGAPRRGVEDDDDDGDDDLYQGTNM